MSETEIEDAEFTEAVESQELVHVPTEISLFRTDDPDEVVERASKIAKSLAKVVQQQKLFTQIGPNKHIRVEGWQTLGAMAGVFAVGEGEPEPVEIDGIKGFRATVVAMRNGEVIGRATAFCMRDEPRWSTQPHHALASMAATRATSKALKGPLGFIVKLAGYNSTPAEEMPGPTPPEPVRVPAQATTESQEATAEAREAVNAHTTKMVTERQLPKIRMMRAKLISDERLPAFTAEAFLAQMMADYGVEHTADLTQADASQLIDRLEQVEKKLEAAS